MTSSDKTKAPKKIKALGGSPKPMPNLDASASAALTSRVDGFDENGEAVTLPVVTERGLTIYLNRQEIITAMTLGDMPEELAVGFLSNQNMLNKTDVITEIETDLELGVIVVRTQTETDFETKLQRKIQTSGCAQGTMLGDMMENFHKIKLNDKTSLKTSTMLSLLKAIHTTPSLYLEAGAIHGCVLAQGETILAYVEDVGRHNAVDKIAGWMFLNSVEGGDKIFYTTGRLTTEMIIKTVQMEIPILISRSGFTQSGVALAREAGLTLIGRARGKRFTILSGKERLIYDE